MTKRRPTGTDAVAAVRQHVVALLEGGHAHATFEQAVKALPPALRAKAPARLPYSPWQLLEHVRIAQSDILEFSRDARHVSPPWPDGYWPRVAKPTEAAWRASVRAFRRDLRAMQALVADSRADLFAPIPWGDRQTLLREALLVADHNAYHLGQLVAVRRLLGAWR
jgi:uncharacterized damage-inducible protein DinB